MDRNQTRTEGPPPRYTASKPVDMSRQPLRYARRPIYILVIYLVLLIAPWLCVCVINRKTTSDPWGIIMRQDLDSYHRWIAAASFFSTVAAVIALPCVAALLAYGAVVFSQRRSKQQTLTVRQLLAISDLKWTAFVSSGQSSSYLLLATGLLLLTAVQPPLQSLLMPPSSRPVYSCDSLRSLSKWDRTCDGKGQPAQAIGKDAEPVLLREANASQIVNTVRTKMVNITSADIQENLWRVDDNHRSFVTGEDQTYNDSFWVSAIPAGVTTGPLRQHSIRLSSTAACQVADEYPANCDGYATSLQGFGISVRTCMPRNNTSPATRGVPPRRRQDVDEVLYIDAQISPEAAKTQDFLSEPAQNVTIKCVAKTSRAFFEIGNLQTGLVPSDIISEWPSDEDMAAHFHDYDWQGNLITNESEDDWNRDRFSGWTSTQGPLRSTAEALFGNGSYPQAVLDLLSQTFPDGQVPDNTTSDSDAKRRACSLPTPLGAWQLPYNSHNDDYDSWYSSIYQGCSLAELPKTLFRIAQGLQYVKVAQSTLGVGMYLSNVAVLQDAASNDAARTIYNLAGTEFVAPRYTVGATVAISLLISMQAIALVVLVCYIYSLPTWTDTLDAFAMMRLGAHLRDSMDFPLVGRASREEMGALDETDGLLGVVVRGAAGRSEEDLELAALASSSTAQRNETPAHQYASVSPLSPTSTVEQDPSAPATQTSHVVDATRPGMDTSELSEYLQGAPPASPTTTTTTTTTVSSPRSPSPPPPYLPARSSNRGQPVRGAFELGLGAPGLITRALWERYRPR